MATLNKQQFGLVLLLLAMVAMVGCDSVSIGGGGSLLVENDNVNVNENTADEPDVVELVVYASNTGGATGIALRPDDGELFLVNADGLFGPIEEGDDVSTMAPIGATNLVDDDLFGLETDSLVLGITNSGEFWIGSRCCVTLAVVPPEGGDAAPFIGLLEGEDAPNIKAENMAVVPEGSDGPQMHPGNLILGQDVFSRLSAIDVEGDRSVVNVDNPAIIADPAAGLDRYAHHLTFTPDGVLYGARSAGLVSEPAIQIIEQSGMPVSVPGTEALSTESFVALESGDLILRSIFDPEGETRLEGLLIWSAQDEQVELGLELPSAETSSNDEMILAADGETIYLSLPNRDEVVLVVLNR